MITLKDITTGLTPRPPRIALYGVPGIGKSSFGAAAPKPVFLATEAGLGAIDAPKISIQSFDEMLEALAMLYTEKHSYETVVIDTLDRLEELVFAEVCKEKDKSSIEDIGFGKGYIFALEYWGQILEALDALNAKGVSSVLLAHSLVKSHNVPDTDPYDRYRLNLHDKAAARVLDWCDVCLFANYKVRVKGGETGKNKALDNHGERVLYTEERPAHWAKNRYRLPYEIPFVEQEACQQIFAHIENFFRKK